MLHRVSSKRVVITSFLVDLSDVFLNLLVAVASGSVIMISQTLQGASDLITSGLLVLGVSRSKRRPDRRHRFGYGREIYFWTLMSGVSMLVVSALISMYLGWQRVLHPEPIAHLPFAVAVLVIGLATNSYAFWLSTRRLTQDQPARPLVFSFIYSELVETKATTILDLMGSAAAIFGLLAYGVYALTGDARFDGIGAVVVGMVTAFFAIFLLFEVKDFLIGRSISPELETEIRAAALEHAAVTAVVRLHSMHFGSEELFVNLDINVVDGKTTNEIEELIGDLKTQIKRTVPTVKHLQIELVPLTA